MHEKPSYQGMYARPYLSTGRTPEEIARFNKIIEDARPHTKGIREREVVKYYDIETMDYSDFRPESNITPSQIEEMVEMLTQLRETYNVTVTVGNHDR